MNSYSKPFFLKNGFLFIILLVISFIILNQKSNYHHTQLFRLSSDITYTINIPYKNLTNYLNLKDINTELLSENTSLKNQILENKITTSKYYFNKNNQFSYMSSQVLKSSFNKSQNYLIINKGKKEGVKEGMGVVSEKGIVGIVNYTSDNFSSVISILNLNFKINAKIKNKNGFGSLSWNGRSFKKMELLDLPLLDKLQEKDTVITGGISSAFPVGIPIGTVSKIEENVFNNHYKIEVALFNDLTHLENVYIIKNVMAEEFNTIDSLNIMN